MEELHEKESQLWAKMKSHYEEVAVTNKRKIENLKKALEESQAHLQVQTDRIRTLLQVNLERFTVQLKAALEKGWDAWETQVAELHTHRVNCIGCRRKPSKKSHAQMPAHGNRQNYTEKPPFPPQARIKAYIWSPH